MNYTIPMSVAVKKAGSVALSHFRSNMKVYKKVDGGFVTEVDFAVEDLLKQDLKTILPGAGFYAEESGITDGNEYVWVIDPIDGTKNFERGLPYFCISVALMHHQEIIAAVTYAPFVKDLFYAQKGFGAWLNDKRLLLQSRDWHLGGVLAVVSGGYIQSKDKLNLIKSACKSVTGEVRFRVYGAAALDLAYAAAGMIDVVMFEQAKWWDIAAGILLVQESKGLAVSYSGELIKQSSVNLIAGNSTVCKLILPTLTYKKEYV